MVGGCVSTEGPDLHSPRLSVRYYPEVVSPSNRLFLVPESLSRYSQFARAHVWAVVHLWDVVRCWCED